MGLRTFKGKEYTAGDRKEIQEEKEEVIKFVVHRFTDQQRPEDPSKVIIYPEFSEFGSEIIACLYCLPLLNKKYENRYKIAMGWYGRAYLYKHLVDEFWEIKEEHQWLRDWCRAFHHDSKNLRKLEKSASKIGEVLSVNELGLLTGHPKYEICPSCKGDVIQLADSQRCLRCLGGWRVPGIFNSIVEAKKEKVVWPLPSCESKLQHVKSRYLKKNSVGISARARKCYGRNLPSIFYERLIYLLEDMGYSPVWIGERATTLPCPLSRIIDFSKSEDANDLEMTLALVSQLKFTVQFWTASTRLAGLVGTPFLLVESPDQIWGIGQEGIRLTLCSKGPYKLLISHYRSFLENQTNGLSLVEKGIMEMRKNNYRDMIGMVENGKLIRQMRIANQLRIGRKDE
jgi:hypothetical protein